MNKLLTVALLLVLPYFLFAQDNPSWVHHTTLWDNTEVDIQNDLGLYHTIDLRAMLSGEDKESIVASIDGQLIDHAYLSGKIVLIDFWFIRCHPCRRELPALSELSKMYPNKEIIILSICRDDASSIKEYDMDHSDTNIHIIANAHPRLTNEGVFNFPFKALINPKGEIVYSFLGGKKTVTPVEDFVEDMSSKIDALKTYASLTSSLD